MQVGWENTLSALCRGQGGGGPNMVKSLDPDAPHRTAKQLHDLDQERGNAHKLILFYLLIG
jgi:hypothetical protein